MTEYIINTLVFLFLFFLPYDVVESIQESTRVRIRVLYRLDVIWEKEEKKSGGQIIWWTQVSVTL